MMAMKKFMMILAMAQMMIWSCVKPEIDTPVTENINPEDVVFTAVTEATKAANIVAQYLVESMKYGS